MSDATPAEIDTFLLESAKVEVAQLWRIVMGPSAPMPDRADRALRRLQAMAVHVEWPHLNPQRELPWASCARATLGLALMLEGLAMPAAAVEAIESFVRVIARDEQARRGS